MSYSFTVRADTKGKVLALADASLANVIKQQPLHESDVAIAMATANDLLDLLDAEPGEDYSIAMHGSISGVDLRQTSAGVGVTVSVVTRT